MSHAAAVIPREEALLPAGHPWTRLPVVGLGLAATGVVLLAVAGGADSDRALASWLVAFVYFLTIALGCTGGQHRSVFIAERLAEYFRGTVRVLVRHRALMP